MAQLRDAFSRFAGGVVDRLPSVLTALVVVLLVAGLARMVRRRVETALRRTTTHTYLPVLLARLAYIGMLLVALVVAIAVDGGTTKARATRLAAFSRRSWNVPDGSSSSEDGKEGNTAGTTRDGVHRADQGFRVPLNDPAFSCRR